MGGGGGGKMVDWFHQEIELSNGYWEMNGFGICYYVKCLSLVLLAQPSSRNLDYPLWDVHLPDIYIYIYIERKSNNWNKQNMKYVHEGIIVCDLKVIYLLIKVLLYMIRKFLYIVFIYYFVPLEYFWCNRFL